MGASTSHNPVGFHGLLTGTALHFTFTCTNILQRGRLFGGSAVDMYSWSAQTEVWLRIFVQSVQANAGSAWIKLRPPPSKSFPLHLAFLDTLLCHKLSVVLPFCLEPWKYGVEGQLWQFITTDENIYKTLESACVYFLVVINCFCDVYSICCFLFCVTPTKLCISEAVSLVFSALATKSCKNTIYSPCPCVCSPLTSWDPLK
jgi:hypothetical protein